MTEAQDQANAAIDAAIAERVATTQLGPQLAADGLTTVALSDDGRLTVHHPDGTTSDFDSSTSD